MTKTNLVMTEFDVERLKGLLYIVHTDNAHVAKYWKGLSQEMDFASDDIYG
jgi:hypothetical protein